MATTKTKKVDTKVDEKATKTHPLIKGLRITEKAARAAQNNAYTFNVATNANKTEIKKAIKMLYGVTPIRVTTTQITEKIVFIRGKSGKKQGGKKAVVYLKKGDKIEFV
ncbi:MAG: 50S ribosomal protein L23 [Candidatus Paceibacterota bacterium]